MNGQPKVAKTSLATYCALRALAIMAGDPELDLAEFVDRAYASLDRFGSKSSQEVAIFDLTAHLAKRRVPLSVVPERSLDG